MPASPTNRQRLSCHTVEDGLFDGLLVGLKEVHGPVELVQLELLSACNVDIFLEPLLMTVEFGDWGAGAVGY